jgi:hypothetical protein
MNLTKINSYKRQDVNCTETNQELRELHKDLDIVADIKNKSLERIG